MRGDPPPVDSADTAVLARRIEQLARSAQAAFVPVADHLQDAVHALLDADATPLLRALQDLHHAVGDARCRELPGWLRWFGPTRDARRRFQSDCRDAIAAHSRVLERAQRLAQAHDMQAGVATTDLDRLSDAAAGLATAVAQAQSLLARLWEQLKPQRPDPADSRSLDALRALLAEVDDHRALVQRLDGAGTTARDLARLGRAVVAGRSELLALAGAQFDGAWIDWSARIEPLLHDGLHASQLVAGARDATAARRGLLLALDPLRTACTRLQIDEQAFGHALTHFREQLVALQPQVTREGAGAPARRSRG